MGVNKILKDIQVMNPSGLKNLMAHVKIVNNNLVLEFDFDSNGRFALSSYLQLKGEHKFGSDEFIKELNELDDGHND